MRLRRRIKIIALCIFAGLGLLNIFRVARSLVLPIVFQKDFIQEYLLARAVIVGLPPYDPLPTLALKIFGSLPNPVFPHPSAHPPPMIILALPFGLLNYRLATILWFFFGLLCLLEASRLLVTRYFKSQSRLLPVLLFLGLCGTYPFFLDLGVGQIMLPILLPFTASWLAIRSNKAALAGGLLALPLSMKYMGWPLIPFLAWRKQWRSLFWAAGVWVFVNLIGMAFAGVSQSLKCYIYVAPSVSRMFRAEFMNFSTWSFGYRLFAGTSADFLWGFSAPPLFNFPAFATYASFLVTACMVLTALVLAYDTRKLEHGCAVLICASTIVNPLSWHNYLVLLLIPASVVVKVLAARLFPLRLTLVAVLIGLMILSPNPERLVGVFVPNSPSTIPAPAALLAFLPLAAASALMLFVWYLTRIVDEQVRPIGEVYNDADMITQ